MVVFDATTLLLILSPTVPPPIDPATGIAVTEFQQRIDLLVRELDRNKTLIIIPTPALSEILVRAGNAGPSYLTRISASASFKIVPFDERAAIEVAMMTRAALDGGDKRDGIDAPWSKECSVCNP